MITKYDFDTIADGSRVHSYLLQHKSGISLRILELGGAIMELCVPDRNGRFTNVVASYDSLADYLLDTTYFGALIGRVANRIAKGKYEIDGREYSAFINNGPNSLHGGRIGFSHRLWTVEPRDGEDPALILTLHSPDGEEGYPGNLDVTVTYTLTADAVSIRYEAVTDQRTPVNLTNHAYFNLGGYASGSILEHTLRLDADRFLPTDADLIPTGELRAVEGTPFDFRTPKTIGRDFDLAYPELALAGGYDHCLCFTAGETETPVLRAEAFEPISGRVMQVLTNQPCVQLYTGNFLKDPAHPLSGGYPQTPQSAFCLETQKMPDALHHAHFDNILLSPGERYDYTTVYRFSVS